MDRIALSLSISGCMNFPRQPTIQDLTVEWSNLEREPKWVVNEEKVQLN